jgi:hypothetical protein
MRSSLAPRLLGSLAVAATLAAATCGPAGASIGPRVAANIAGYVTSLTPTGEGGFLAAVAAPTGSAQIQPVGTDGTLGPATTLPSWCGASPPPEGMAPIGTSGSDYAWVDSSQGENVHLNGLDWSLGQVPTGYQVAGLVVGPADAQGSHTAYLALNDDSSTSARLDEITFDASGSVQSTDSVTGGLSHSLLGHPTFAEGAIWVSDIYNEALLKISGHTVSTVLGAGVLGSPGSVALDATGGVYVVDNRSDQLFQVTSAGATALLTYGTPVPLSDHQRGSAPIGEWATALAFDPATRSLLLARTEAALPGMHRTCMSPDVTTSILRIGTAPQAPLRISVVLHGHDAVVSWMASADAQPGDH